MDMVPLFIVSAALDKGHIKGTVFVPDLFESSEIPGVTAEMAYSGSDYDAAWARAQGLVNEVYDSLDELTEATANLAHTIATNSPLVTKGIKKVLAAADGRTIDEALDYVAQWNSSFLISNDLMEAVAAFVEKRDPDFKGS